MFRLGSVIPHGVGDSPESIIIDTIYSYLLKEFGQNVYSFIRVNQIGDDLDELIMKDGKKMHINIRYPVYEDFEKKPVNEQNRVRLDVAHTSLLRIAEYDKKLDVSKLEAIRDKILENNFSFDFVCKTHVYKKRPNLTAKIIVHPENKKFDYYALIEEDGKEKCRAHIYSGQPASIYSYRDFFSIAKFKGENELILTGKSNTVEIRILINQCTVEYINLTPYKNPPFFEIMRAGISEEDKEKAYQDWLHSLPPSHAAIIRQAHN